MGLYVTVWGETSTHREAEDADLILMESIVAALAHGIDGCRGVDTCPLAIYLDCRFISFLFSSPFSLSLSQ